MLSKKAVNEFKEIYFKKEGKRLSDKEAFELATNLILAFEAIYRPIPEEDKSKPNKRKQRQIITERSMALDNK